MYRLSRALFPEITRNLAAAVVIAKQLKKKRPETHQRLSNNDGIHHYTPPPRTDRGFKPHNDIINLWKSRNPSHYILSLPCFIIINEQPKILESFLQQILR